MDAVDAVDTEHRAKGKTGPKWTLQEDQRLEEAVRGEAPSGGLSRAQFWSRVARRLGHSPSASANRRCARRWAKVNPDAVPNAAPKDVSRAAAAPSPVDVMRLQDVLPSDVDDASDADDEVLVFDLAALLVDDADDSSDESGGADLSTCEILSVTTIGSLSSIGDLDELDEALFVEANARFRWDEMGRLGRFGDGAAGAPRPVRAHAQRRAARRALRIAPCLSPGTKRAASGRITPSQTRCRPPPPHHSRPFGSPLPSPRPP